MTVNLKNFIYQKAGKYLQWNEIASGISAVNGTPTPGTSGIVVSDFDVAKLAVEPQNGATVDFRLWYQYEGLSQFFVVDSSERNNITTNWTQEIDISGLDRIYVEILSIDTGSVDVHVAQAEDKETIVGFKRIGNWEEAGTGDQDGDVMVWKNDSGQEALFEWDGTNSIWILQSTGEEWFLLDDWASSEINDSLWTIGNLGNTPVSYTVNGASNRIELEFTSGASGATEEFVIEPDFQVPKSVEVYAEGSLNGASVPSTGSLTVRSVIYYNTVLDDAVHAMLERNPSAAQFSALDRPVGGGSSQIQTDALGNDTLSYDLYTSAKNVWDEETQFNAGYTQTGSGTFIASTLAANEFTHVVSANNGQPAYFASSTADVTATLYLGPVYVRR